MMLYRATDVVHFMIVKAFNVFRYTAQMCFSIFSVILCTVQRNSEKDDAISLIEEIELNFGNKRIGE